MRKRTSSRFAGRSRRTRRAPVATGEPAEALTERRFAAFTTPSDELRHAHSRTALRRRRCARLSAPLRAYYAPRLAPALELYKEGTTSDSRGSLRTRSWRALGGRQAGVRRAAACGAHAAGERVAGGSRTRCWQWESA
jgi:hypothetical protein